MLLYLQNPPEEGGCVWGVLCVCVLILQSTSPKLLRESGFQKKGKNHYFRLVRKAETKQIIRGIVEFINTSLNMAL